MSTLHALERSILESTAGVSDRGANHPHLAFGAARALGRQKLRIGSRHGGLGRSPFQAPQPWPAAPSPTVSASPAREDLSPVALDRFVHGQPAASLLSVAHLRHA